MALTPPFAPCPKCRATDARPVGFTWWGGLLGPKLFNHVKCASCATTFDAKTGRSNDGKIIAYTVVMVGLSVLVMVLILS